MKTRNIVTTLLLTVCLTSFGMNDGGEDTRIEDDQQCCGLFSLVLLVKVEAARLFNNLKEIEDKDLDKLFEDLPPGT